MITIAEVIGWKFNHQEGMSTKSGVITEFPGGIPSQEDQDSWTEEYLVVFNAQAYAQSRKAEYPSIEDCIHAILDNELEALQVKRQAVKTKYPRP